MALQFAYSAFATADEFLDDAAWSSCETYIDPDDDATIAAALDNGSDILTRLSGLRFKGVRTVTNHRPDMGAVLERNCRRIKLPADTIAVTSVIEGGVTLTADEDYQRRGDELIRIDSSTWTEISWGAQNLLAPHTEPDTIAISFTRGVTPSMMEKKALFEVAADLIRSWHTGGPSVLSGVVSISGGGVSVVREEGDESNGLTAVMPNVARFLSLWNPGGTAVPNAVFSPDVPGTCGGCWR